LYGDFGWFCQSYRGCRWRAMRCPQARPVAATPLHSNSGEAMPEARGGRCSKIHSRVSRSPASAPAAAAAAAAVAAVTLESCGAGEI
jgi:hypothetical protein